MDNNEILLKTVQKENALILENYNKLKFDDEKKYDCLQEEFNKLQANYNSEKEINSSLRAERDTIKQQLDSILYSRSYKIMQKIKKILGR